MIHQGNTLSYIVIFILWKSIIRNLIFTVDIFFLLLNKILVKMANVDLYFFHVCIRIELNRIEQNNRFLPDVNQCNCTNIHQLSIKLFKAELLENIFLLINFCMHTYIYIYTYLYINELFPFSTHWRFYFWKLYNGNYIQLLLEIFQVKSPYSWIEKKKKLKRMVYTTYCSGYHYVPFFVF